MDPLPSPSPLSASPKVSTPPGKARYRSKPRHRRANSKGSHSEFPGLLKPVVGAPEDTQSIQEQQFHHHHHHHHHQPPTEGPFLPLKGREEAVVNCANNLRYFGPAAALRSPQTDHLQRRVSGSSPDLISTAVDVDTRQRTLSTSSNPVPGAGTLCPCCQAHPFPGCLHCQETPPASNHPELPHYSLLNTQEATPSLGSPGKDPASDGEATQKTESQDQEAGEHSLPLPTPLPRTLRPLRKVSTAGTAVGLLCMFVLRKLGWFSYSCFSFRVVMSHLKRKRGRLIVKWSFQGDRGKIKLEPWPSPYCFSVTTESATKENYRASLDKCAFCLLPHRPHRCMSSFQSYSTFSSENLSVSDGEEGNTSDHSHSGPLERLSASQEEHLDELLSHTPDIPIDISTQSDGLSDKECAVRRVKTQISLGKLCSDEHSYEVSDVDVCSLITLAWFL